MSVSSIPVFPFSHAMDVETKGTWGQQMQGNPGITGIKRAPYCMRLMEKEKTDFIKIQVCMLQFVCSVYPECSAMRTPASGRIPVGITHVTVAFVVHVAEGAFPASECLLVSSLLFLVFSHPAFTD